MNQDDLEAWRAQIDLITELKELERLNVWMSINLPTVAYGVLELNLRARRKILMRDVLRRDFKFDRVNSTRFRKKDQELMAYEIPISRVIEANSVKMLDDATRDLAVFGEAWIEVKKP